MKSHDLWGSVASITVLLLGNNGCVVAGVAFPRFFFPVAFYSLADVVVYIFIFYSLVKSGTESALM